MILSFKCKETERIWAGRSSRKFPVDILDRALRKLRQLDASRTAEDLRNPPGNRLEVLQGARAGQMTSASMIGGASVSGGSSAMPMTSRSSIIIEGNSRLKDAAMAQLRNPHPGEILKEEFLNEIGMSQNKLAEALGVPGNRIHAIVNGTRDISADTDLRLCKFFSLSEGYFLRLQNTYDTLEAKRRLSAELARIKPYKPRKAA